jgi:cobalt-zinc-cadmium efflux system protein
MAHDHGHDHGAGAGRAKDRRKLALALGLTSSFMLAEVIGGLLTGSLALLADAAHMLSDAFSLVLALGAAWLADRPATPKRTFGYKRVEILAALANGATLVLVSAWILYEAVHRLSDPPEVLGGPLLIVALVGLAVNVASASILHRGHSESLNVSAALRHVIADLLGSLGVLVAGVVILTTGWRPIDPLISILIGLLVLASAWPVLRDSVRILLEGSPRGIDVEELGGAMAGVAGVQEVHDLHVWTITSGFTSLSAHVLVGPSDDCHERRRELERLLKERFQIEHTTLQVDHARRPQLIPLEPQSDPGGS